MSFINEIIVKMMKKLENDLKFYNYIVQKLEKFISSIFYFFGDHVN